MRSSAIQKKHIFVPDGLLGPQNAQFKVLVVDGSHFFTSEVEKFLETEGHQVMQAGSLDEALSKLSQFRPDLILFDNAVEGVSGRNFVSELLIEQPSAGLVILARNPTVSEAAAAIRQGATDYQAAPLDVEKLKELIESQKAFF
jgi:DNA-binding NtrC family response regulator